LTKVSATLSTSLGPTQTGSSLPETHSNSESTNGPMRPVGAMSEIHSHQTATLAEVLKVRNEISELEEELERLKCREAGLKREFRDVTRLINEGGSE
jgi:hypothetical protein